MTLRKPPSTSEHTARKRAALHAIPKQMRMHHEGTQHRGKRGHSPGCRCPQSPSCLAPSQHKILLSMALGSRAWPYFHTFTTFKKGLANTHLISTEWARKQGDEIAQGREQHAYVHKRNCFTYGIHLARKAAHIPQTLRRPAQGGASAPQMNILTC